MSRAVNQATAAAIRIPASVCAAENQKTGIMLDMRNHVTFAAESPPVTFMMAASKKDVPIG